ncbi:MAG: trypsin-like peptidase domain-containing protein [Kibdelosporangium sp.]
MTTTQQPQTPQHYGPAYYPPMAPPPAYGGGLPPTGGPVPPALAGPGKPGRFRKGAVALSIAAVLAAGAVGGVTGALVGDDGNSAATVTNSAPISQSVGSNAPADVSGVAAKVLPSVVQVNVRLANAEGIGSGVILTADGRILTNNHVVAGANQVEVTLNDGRRFQANVVGTDAASDLAVIQLQGASGLTPATLGDSSTVKVGDEVVAFGSPGGLQGTVTSGIVSALNRPVNVPEEQSQGQNPFTRNGNGSQTSYQAIQTDASINQGNSGGALVDADGRLIGINSAIYSPVSTSDGSAGSVGIGFAIPINTAKTVVDQILAGS